MYYLLMSLPNSCYDPATEVALVAMQPLWDWRGGGTSFNKCFSAMYDAVYATRAALSYPGEP